MNAIDHRSFLVRSGLALSAAMLSSDIPLLHASAPAEPSQLFDWQAVRAQFPLSRDLIHLAGFFLASHPTPVREAIERHRAGLDAGPELYQKWHDEQDAYTKIVLKPGMQGVEAA